jgi:hypothetical protein
MTAMWAYIAQKQIHRLGEAAVEFRGAMADTAFRTAFNAKPNPAWQSEFDRSDRRLTQAAIWGVAAERYFLMNALAQVPKCVLRLPNDGLPDIRNQKAIRLLRDIDEHWEQPVGVGRSLTEMRQTDPDAGYGQVRWNNKHLWLGDVSLEEFADWVNDVAQQVRSTAAAAGVPMPDPDEPFAE